MCVIECTLPLNVYMYWLVSPPHRISLMRGHGLFNVFFLSLSPAQKESCVITRVYQQFFDIKRHLAVGLGIVTLPLSFHQQSRKFLP